MAQTSNFVSSLAIAIPRKFFPPTRTLRPPRYLAPPHSNVFLPTRIMFVPLDISHSPLELSPPGSNFLFSPSRYRFPSTVLEFFLARSTIFYFIVQRSSLHRTLPPPLEVSPPQTEPFFPNSIFVSFRIRISLNSNISPDSIYFRLLRHFAVPPQIAFPLTRTVGLLFKVRRSWPRLWCGHGLAPCSWLWIAPLVPSLVAVCFVATVHPWLLL